MSESLAVPGLLPLFGSIGRAYLVASYLNDELDQERDWVWLQAYANGREQGFCLIGRRQSFSFSEARGSDDMVVYIHDPPWDLQVAGNIPTDETYEKRRFFFGNELEAAAFIIEQVKKKGGK
jgi:hypothetical protein